MTVKEIDRIRAEYARREQTIPTDRYSLSAPANLFAHQQKNRVLLNLLREEGVLPLETCTLLDVGCGDGQQLLDFVSWGARRTRLAGIDLLEGRIARAATRLGGHDDGGFGPDLRVGDASHLPWPDDTFDVVHQSTMFTSIIDPGMKREIAREILRVLKPGGVLVWYDFFLDNPRNPHVRGVGKQEIRSLFPGCTARLTRVTLAPPLARRLVPVLWIGAMCLEHLTIFNTHYLGIIRKVDNR